MMAQHNLPRQMTSFVGRMAEIADLVALLDNPDCQLLTLVGPGGVGKTRLAIEVARCKLDDFADGVWFVSLAPQTAPDQLPATVAHTLQVSPGPDSQSLLKQSLLDFLRERQLLLVLDNLEHLLEGVELVHEMLLVAPAIKILVTSRVVLNMQAEWVQPVHGMRYPTRASDDNLDGFSAVQLFAERGRQVQPNFDLAAVSDCAVHICQMVDGVPLGIELAAAWLRTLPCETIAKQIQRGLDFLASDRHDVPERHRSMRAVFEHTWGLLNSKEQQVFERFSVFHGGCTLEAAEAVTGATLAVLDSLVEKSLLSLDSQGRYQTHELVRQYGEEKLESASATDRTRDAHSAYYARFMAELDPKIKGENQIEALDAIEPDFENVRAAWLWALERRDYAAIDGMLEALDLFCVAGNRFDVLYALFAQAWEKLAPAGDELPHRVWGRVLARPNFYPHHDYERIRKRREQALDIARQYDDQLEFATCLYWLGETYACLHDFQNAIACLEQCVALFRTLGERFWQARALNELGICHIQKGQPAEAIPYSQAGLDLRRQIGDEVGTAWCLNEIGSAYWQLGQVDRALQCWYEAIEHFRAVGTFPGHAITLHRIARTLFWNGSFEELLRFEETMYTEYKRYIYQEPPLWDRLFFGLASGIEGDYEHCRLFCKQALGSDTYIEYFESLFTARLGVAIVACGLEDWELAVTYLQEMLMGIKPAGNSDMFGWKTSCLPVAALVLDHEGEPEHAAELLGLTFSLPAHRVGWAKRWG